MNYNSTCVFSCNDLLFAFVFLCVCLLLRCCSGRTCFARACSVSHTKIRRERRSVYEDAGVSVTAFQGDDITDDMMDTAFFIYKSTIDKVWWVGGLLACLLHGVFDQLLIDRRFCVLVDHSAVFFPASTAVRLIGGPEKRQIAVPTLSTFYAPVAGRCVCSHSSVARCDLFQLQPALLLYCCTVIRYIYIYMLLL